MSELLKNEDGVEYPAAAYGYVQSAHDPSTWKLRLWESPEAKVTAAQLGRAAASLSSAAVPGVEVGKVKARIRAAYEGLGTHIDAASGSVAAFALSLDAITLSADAGPVRMPLVMIGTFWKGKRKFTITPRDIETASANRAQSDVDAPLDYEHASEHPEMALGGPVPAAGWIKSIDAKADNKGVVWGEVELNEQARELIRNGEYRYTSASIDWNAINYRTGKPQGFTITSAALTNRPALEGMPAISLSAGWSMSATNEEGERGTVAQKVMCSDHSDTQMLCPECDKGKLSASAHEHNHGLEVIALSAIKRDGVGRLDLSSIPAGGVIGAEVLLAFEQQRVALNAVDRAIAAGRIAPANKDQYTRLALSNLPDFEAITKDMQQVPLGERGISGSGAEGSAKSELDKVNGSIHEKALTLSKDRNVEYADAMKLAASAHPDLFRERHRLQREILDGRAQS